MIVNQHNLKKKNVIRVKAVTHDATSLMRLVAEKF